MAQAYSWPALTVGEPEDMASLRERARQEGYQDGYQAGNSSALEEASQLRQTLRESVSTVAAMERQLGEQDRQEILQLLRTLTRTLIGVELKTNEQVIAAFVSEALELLNCERSEVTLNIAAEDESWLIDLDGIRVVVVPGQRPGTLSLCSPRASVEFDALKRLEELLEVAGAADAD
jgi:flagellar biosynthesis/type III secretory pathway protein FliH